MKTVKIIGTGSYLPKREVSNDEIAGQLNSTSEWIVSHTGIESRHVAAPEESAASMGAEAARAALEMAKTAPEEIGLIILGTTTPDYVGCPATACLVQKELGCVNAAAFDLAAACSGFVYGLEMAKCYLLSHPGQKVLVVGSELLTRSFDWSDRSIAMLFGDGAGAAVLATEDVEDVFVSASIIGADGNGARQIHRESTTRQPLSSDHVHEVVREAPVQYLHMDGHAVFTFAVRKLEEVLRGVAERTGTDPETLDWIFPHQANLRILDAVARRMKLPMDKFYTYLDSVGNTSSASIPLCLDRAVRQGSLKDGMKIAMIGFGSGLTWAGMLVRWPYL